MKTLVTGATGHLGQLVVDALLNKIPASEIAVSVRNPEKAEAYKNTNVEVRQGDFDNPKELVQTFSGINRLLIISTDGDTETRTRQHRNAVEAAQKAGVKHIVYTSVTHAKENELFLAIVHKETEKAIEHTGIPYTFLRNNWYMENEISSIQGALAGAPWLTAAGNGKVGWALRRDYAEAAATVLAEDGHENQIYELTGKPHTQAELVEALNKITGKETQLVEVSDEAYAETMKSAGVPEAFIPMVVAIQQDIKKGTLEYISDDFKKILGRPPVSLEDGLKELIQG